MALSEVLEESPMCGGSPPSIAPRTPTEMILAEIVAELVGRERVGITEDFFALGGQQSSAARLASRVEEAFRIRLPPETVFEHPTVASLAGIVAAPSDGRTASGVYLLRSGSTRPALFLMPAVTGLHYSGRTLAERLEPGRPIYCVLLPERSGAPFTFPSLTELARYCTDRIVAAESEGPLHIAGGSFGGKLAYEVACQLRERGRRVGLVAIIDSEAFKRAPVSLKQWIECARFFLTDGPYLFWHDLSTGRIGRSLRSAALRAWGALASEPPHQDLVENVVDRFGLSRLPPAFAEIVRIHIESMTRHEERPFPGRVTLIRARRTNVFESYSRDLGWGRVARSVDVRIVPGDHWTMNEPPSLDLLVSHLTEALAAADQDLSDAGRP